jgi:uncharacterized protein
LIVDEIIGIRVLITGSSSISLSETSEEPLTGRKMEIDLYPFSLSELRNKSRPVEIRQNLEERIVYGSYPEILKLQRGEEKRLYLEEIVRSYLLKYHRATLQSTKLHFWRTYDRQEIDLIEEECTTL